MGSIPSSHFGKVMESCKVRPHRAAVLFRKAMRDSTLIRFLPNWPVKAMLLLVLGTAERHTTYLLHYPTVAQVKCVSFCAKNMYAEKQAI